MIITFMGYGNVGAPLADQLQRLGHTVILAAANAQSASVKQALTLNSHLQVKSSEEAVQCAEVVFLATPFNVAEDALQKVKTHLTGKIVVDCTNPVGAGLTHGLNSIQSGSSYLQALLPDSAVVKAFTIYGFENLQNNHFPNSDLKPVMMYCGDQPAANATVAALIAQLGWQPLDVGGLEQALHLEHLTLLWIRMVRLQGRNPHTVWALLER